MKCEVTYGVEDRVWLNLRKFHPFLAATLNHANLQLNLWGHLLLSLVRTLLV